MTKRLLRKMGLAAILAGTALSTGSCTATPLPEVRVPQQETLYDIVTRSMSFYETGQTDKAENYLLQKERQIDNPTVDFLLAATLSYNGNIFNGKYRQASDHAWKLVRRFEGGDTDLFFDIKNSLPSEFFELEFYREGKALLEKRKWMHANLEGAYGILFLLEGDYENARKIISSVNDSFDQDMMRTIGTRLEELASKMARNGDMDGYHEIQKLAYDLNPKLDPRIQVNKQPE